MFKKAVIALLLLTTPFAQARAVLICSMMNDEVVEQCCCPGHTEHAPAPHTAPDAGCCEVGVAVSDKAFAGVTADPSSLKRVAHDAPTVFTVAPSMPPVPTFAVALHPPSGADAPRPLPYRLYLRTARLRL